MTKITKDQALERWDALPEVLREALSSEINSDFLWKTCEEEHIPDEKIYAVSRISGYVLMGFVHPEDVASEITDALQIDHRISESIATALNQRIFTPLRPDIDKIYNPKIIPPAAPVVLPTATPTPAPTPSKPATPQPQAPTPLQEKGWSTIKLPEAAPKPGTGPAPFPPAPLKMTTGMPASSISTLPATGKVMTPPAPSGAPAPVAPKPAPAMIMKGGDVPQPIKNAPDLRAINRTTENIMPGGAAASAPLKPAILELGEMPQKTSASPIKAPISSAAKVVHYSDLKSALPTELPTGKTPVAESGRHIMEMTAESAPSPLSGPKPMTIQGPAAPIITAKPGITSEGFAPKATPAGTAMPVAPAMKFAPPPTVPMRMPTIGTPTAPAKPQQPTSSSTSTFFAPMPKPPSPPMPPKPPAPNIAPPPAGPGGKPDEKVIVKNFTQ